MERLQRLTYSVVLVYLWVMMILLGAIMLVGADLIVRVIFTPIEVPAGTVTAIIGAPYFLFLLMGKQRHDG